MTTDSPISKPDLRHQALLTLGFLLLVMPAGVATLSTDLNTLGVALGCAGVALVAQHQLNVFLKPPRWVRWCFLPGVISAPVFATIGLPYPVSVFVPVFAFAWILNSAGWPKPPFWGRAAILALLSWAYLSFEQVTPDFGFPRLPSSTFLWVVIALVAPLAIATQPRLRGFARGVVLTEFLLVFAVISLTPLTLQIITGFKEVGEPERHFFELEPLPGFTTVSDVRTEEWFPDEFDRFTDPVVALRVLDHMNHTLQLHELESAGGGYEPGQAVFLLRQFGLLQNDRYGFFVSPEVYGPFEPPEHMDPAFTSVVNALARHTSFDITDEPLLTELAKKSRLPATTKAFRKLMLRLRGLNLVDTIPGNASVFRLTPQARHRLSNGLFPRQILFATTFSGNTPSTRIHHADYAPEWRLSFEELRYELIQLVDAGAL